jgi:hypothetical protein
MKFYKPAFVRVTAFGLWVTALCGCEGRSERKKLPDFRSLYGWEDRPLTKTGVQPFQTNDTSIAEGGRLCSFVAVALPDPSGDSLAVSIATSYGPVAGTLIEQWARLDKRGILIDLRSQPGNDDYRADYLVKANLPDNDHFNVPVVFVWDHGSANRAGYFIKEISSIPEIKCDLISEEHHAEGKAKNDCFSPVEPGFGQQ